MSSSCAQWRGEIGAYVVGALDGSARDRIFGHLAACAGCRADYDELAPVRDWLGLLDLTAAEPEPDLPSSRGMRCSRRSRRANREASGREHADGFLVAGAATAAAAIAVVVSSGASAQTFGAVDSATGVSGHAQLHHTPTGTQIDLTASGLPGNERCILVAVTHGGTDIAGSWNTTYDGSARISGTTAYPASQLTALRIESDTGSLLLSIRV